MLRTVLPLINRGTCIAVRTYRRDGNRRPRDQAGVRIQTAVFGDVTALEEDPERNFEADFNQLHVSHRKHEEELTLRKEQRTYFIVKNKYFKTEKQPNFLTWAEKEQIRNLYKNEPEEWTSGRLAESFPAVEDVIIKILKSKWSPANMKRIQKHDEAVKKNWELFKNNQMKNLDPEVREHLVKFSSRNFDSIQNAYAQTNNDQIEFKFPKPKTQEFLHIISSCKGNNKIKEPEPINQIDQKQKQDQHLLAENKSSKESKISSKENITYNQLIEMTNKKSNTIDDDDTHFSVSLLQESTPVTAADVQNDVMNQSATDTSEYPYLDASEDNRVVNLTEVSVGQNGRIAKFATSEVRLATSTKCPVPTIHMKVAIPARLRKSGSIYKVSDCFYDHQGDFLYRVPGLGD